MEGEGRGVLPYKTCMQQNLFTFITGCMGSFEVRDSHVHCVRLGRFMTTLQSEHPLFHGQPKMQKIKGKTGAIFDSILVVSIVYWKSVMLPGRAILSYLFLCSPCMPFQGNGLGFAKHIHIKCVGQCRQKGCQATGMFAFHFMASYMCVLTNQLSQEPKCLTGYITQQLRQHPRGCAPCV